MADLKALFTSFSTFGKGHNTSDANQMDNKCFAKFCKDAGITKGKVSEADVDIVFTKVKAKGARQVDYQQFMTALKELAAKKFPERHGEACMEALVAAVMASNCVPSLDKTTVASNDQITTRLTDTTKYTGTHKERFDETGKGKGLDGRMDNIATMDMKEITNRKAADKRGVQK